MKIFTHKSVSFLKSGIRIFAYAAMLAFTISPIIFFIFFLLMIAELIGIGEEFFQ